MLCHLQIENYALIYRLDLDINPGLTVITGETGAGKSIILGAVGLILGQRADTSVLMDKKQKCLVEGTFDISGLNFENFFTENDLDYEPQCILRREINPQGKSRAFINDIPVNLNQLKALGDLLVDIHSQHGHLLLREASFQLDVLDHYALHGELQSEYQSAWSVMKRLEKELALMQEQERQARLDEDYYNFLLNELQEAHLNPEEQSKMEAELGLLTHAEEVKANLFKASEAMNKADVNVISLMNEALYALSNAVSYMPSLSEAEERMRSLYIEAKDLASEIEKAEDDVIYNPETIQQYSDRLAQLYSLQKKHHVDNVVELISLQNSLEEKLNKLASLSGKIEELVSDFKQKQDEVVLLANKLSKGRTSVISQVEKNLVGLLANMGLPNASIRITNNKQDSVGPTGIDAINFLFNANKGGELKEIAKVASGGELSRLMLAVKSLISKQKLMPTLIFDEIDLGISGEVADKVGLILQQLANSLQVLVITHLPQIAAKGEHHAYVYKVVNAQTTHTHIRTLSADERIVEIAKMMSGENVSKSAVETAKELLAKN